MYDIQLSPVECVRANCKSRYRCRGSLRFFSTILSAAARVCREHGWIDMLWWSQTSLRDHCVLMPTNLICFLYFVTRERCPCEWIVRGFWDAMLALSLFWGVLGGFVKLTVCLYRLGSCVSAYAWIGTASPGSCSSVWKACTSSELLCLRWGSATRADARSK